MDVKQISIGNVAVSLFENKEHFVRYLTQSITEGKTVTAVAVNPEKIILAKRNSKILDILNRSTIKYADGIGIVKAIKQKTGLSVVRLPGCEMWEILMSTAGKEDIPVFLVGANNDVIEQTQYKLIQQYNTPIVGIQDGYYENESFAIEKIKNSGAKIVTVAMGSPRQEQFIFKCCDAGINAIFMGVGGTYDVYTGNVKRAPLIWQKMGCEWLYRLLSQPTRWRRQVNLLHFIWLYFLGRL